MGTKGTERKDVEVIPEYAIRKSEESNRHTGRGGAGNEQHPPAKEEPPKAASPVGLADKLKAKLFGKKKK